MKKIIVFGISLLFLTACVKTPNEVKNNMGKYNSDTDLVQEGVLQYDSISNIFGNTEEILNANYQNLIMPKKINVENIKSLPVMTFKQLENFDKNYLEVMQLFFDKSVIDKQEIKFDKFPDGTEGYGFDNQKDKISASVDNNGLITIRQSDAYNLIFQNNSERVKIIHVDRGENTDVAYKLADGECSVKSQVEYIENWFNSNWAKFDKDFTFKVKTVIVRKINADTFYYQMTIESLYNNIPLDELPHATMAHDEVKDKDYYTSTIHFIDIQVLNHNTISSLTNGVGMIKVDSVDSKVDKFVTLKSAVKLLEKELSGFQDIKISDIELKYTLSPKYDYVNELINEDGNGNKTIITQSTYAPGITITSRPVWAFTIDVDENEYKEKDGTIKKGDVRKYIYVDAITGEIQIGLDNTLSR